MDKYIPLHLITEILSKLPVKSLLKFRCVSKSWLSVIWSPQFIKAHLKDHASEDNQRLLILGNFGSFKHCSLKSLMYGEPSPRLITLDIPIPLPDERSGRGASSFTEHISWYGPVRIVGCCDGLICISVTRASQSDFILWNPSIRKYKKLPNLGLPSTSPLNRVWGFGYDSFSDDYKAVILVKQCSINGEGLRVETRVYSRKSEAWRRIADFPSTPRYTSPSSGVLVNGKLHFLAHEKVRGRIIVSLDLATETYGEMEEPNHYESDVCVTLSEIEGILLYFINPFPGPFGRGGDLWVMKEYGGSWTKVLTFPHEPSGPFCPKLLSVSAEGELLMRECDGIELYSSREGKSFRLLKEIYNVFDAYCFTESLVLPSTHDSNCNDNMKPTKF
nr:F-box/kelch-repeat protein At3g23880-like [Coffea arabica]